MKLSSAQLSQLFPIPPSVVVMFRRGPGTRDNRPEDRELEADSVASFRKLFRLLVQSAVVTATSDLFVVHSLRRFGTEKCPYSVLFLLSTYYYQLCCWHLGQIPFLEPVCLCRSP